MIAIVLSSVVSAVVCVGIYVLVTRFITKNTIRAQREAALKEAEAEGEMIKKERILQAKEKFIQLKSDYDRQVNERNQKLAQSEQYCAVICLGAVIRGSTTHYDYVCNEVSKGIAQVGLQTGVPVLFGVVTTENLEQAIERAGTKAGNKGADAALAALELVDLLPQLR